jgi:hypothetical protein
VRQQLLRQREIDLQENGFWLYELDAIYFRGDDPLEIIEYSALIDNMTAAILQRAAQRYLDQTNYVHVVLLPEGFASGTAILEEYIAALPERFLLKQNFPNPFNSATAFRFSLPTAATIKLTIYNMAGQQVATLLSGKRQADDYAIMWDGLDDSGQALASGIYMYRLQAGEQVEQRKLLLLR